MYTWVEGDTENQSKVSCPAVIQHSQYSAQPGLEPGLLDPEVSSLTMKPPCLQRCITVPPTIIIIINLTWLNVNCRLAL